MKLLLIILVFLAGCVHNPVPVPPPEFPKISDKMLYKCPDLLQAQNSELLSDLLKTVTKNYGQYHECKAAVEAWHMWYTEQKANYEKVKP